MIGKRELNELYRIRETLQRAAKYAERPNVGLCLKGGKATTTLHAVRPLDGEVLYEVEKRMGSEFCLMWTALESLDNFLNNASSKGKETV